MRNANATHASWPLSLRFTPEQREAIEKVCSLRRMTVIGLIEDALQAECTRDGIEFPRNARRLVA